MSTEIDELKQARYRSDKTISGHNAFLRPPTAETNSVDTRGFYFVLKEPHPIVNSAGCADRERETSFEATGACSDSLIIIPIHGPVGNAGNHALCMTISRNGN